MPAITPKFEFRSACSLLILLMLGALPGCGGDAPMQSWHEVELNQEFTVDMLNGPVRSFTDYQALEERLFRQLQEEVYAGRPGGPEHALERYSPGSAADPSGREPNWNRSFELPADTPRGGMLLLHGMSDSPYSLRDLGAALNRHGYWVIGLRVPGHGTVPSGLRHMTWRDMAAATGLGMRHLSDKLGDKPIHMMGYSTGAALALNHALDAIDDPELAIPASLVLISPAIRVHASSALAGFKDSLSVLPGLDQLAYLAIMDEFDPYKYNSFATNAGAQVHGITRNVDRRIAAMAGASSGNRAADKMPPILVFKSTVDSTVTTAAVVDNLLKRLPAGRNELVLFDINRHAALQSTLLIDDPAPLTERVLNAATLPFAVTFVTNENSQSDNAVVRRRPAGAAQLGSPEALGLAWPRNVVSLSHVALPIAPNDPLYGQNPPENPDRVFLGNLAITGERGLLKIPGDWLLRLRYNPFYAFVEQRVLDWVDEH